MIQTSGLSLPNLMAAVKRRQQETWASGDFATVAVRIVFVAEQLCESADLQAGWRVLDVATGTGNAAIAAARRGCTVTGVDYVPALLAHGRARAAVERIEVEFAEADAEDLPFADGTFDAVTSVFGAMFAPDQERAAAELLRVVKPGGTIALASWTPDGFVQELFDTLTRHVPAPAWLASPMLWGSEPYLRQLFGAGITALETQPRVHVPRFRSPEEFVEFYRRWYGPIVQAFAALEGPARDALENDLLRLAHARNRLETGGFAVDSTYLEAIATRR
jgi:ubiquinone/menaquinone biosynthesis C-methylase UbiE